MLLNGKAVPRSTRSYFETYHYVAECWLGDAQKVTLSLMGCSRPMRCRGDVVWKEFLTVWGLEPGTMERRARHPGSRHASAMARPNLLAKGPVTAHLTEGGLLTAATGHCRDIHAAGLRRVRP
jgi:hypothetical protein